MKPTVLFLFCCLLLGVQQGVFAQKIDLAGTWQFWADPFDKGVAEKWYDRGLKESVALPGSMTSNGKGDEVTLKTPWTGQIVDSSFYKKPEYAPFREPGNIKIPFWLQPVKYYKGAAWYQKEVNIPDNWKEKAILLYLERCHWESRLWVDGKEAGRQNSLGTPHQYLLTGLLSPGKHRLTLCIDNRVKEIDPGINSHSISDHTQTNWNGAVGQLYLEARPLLYVQNIQVYPDIQNKTVTAKLKIANQSGKATPVRLKLTVTGSGVSQAKSGNFELKEGQNDLSMELSLGEKVKFWSEFHPELYSLTADLAAAESKVTDTRSITFGMREFKVSGKQLLINGQPLFLRGTLECAIFPKTGYPATELSEWQRIFSICRAHGLNHLRFHSWCPPEAAFAAADQAGFYLQVECSSWANQSTTIGDGKPFDRYLYEESQRMVDQYGNHPSFCMMVYGNEPAGRNHKKFLSDFVQFWKGRDNRRIYTSGAGWPLLPVNDYLSDPTPRIQRWGEGVKSIINGSAPNTDYDWSEFNARYPQPVVSHEIGQWCVYPDFKEIARYNGVLRARNFELFQTTLREHGMERLSDSFLLASGKLQALCYKADIEAALRTRGFGGFQLLDLHDFPGQGTALVGVLNAFWGEKGYISPAEYKRFCNSTVPLARLKKCVFTNEETFNAEIEVAHFGEGPIRNCTPEWKITDKKGKILYSGKLSTTTIQPGNGLKLGRIAVALANCRLPEQLALTVTLASYSNSWDFWVYPAVQKPVEGDDKIEVVQQLNDQSLKKLQNGGSVLLTLKKGTLTPEMGGDVQIGFSSIFWNTAWTRGQAPHTLGILCNPKHPALADFPTDYHSNWQWWDAMSHSNAINLSRFPTGLQPIVRVIDDWFTNRPLALVLEGKVGKGRIVVTGIDLLQDAGNRPEARQLLLSLKKYMTGKNFKPGTEFPVETLLKLQQK